MARGAFVWRNELSPWVLRVLTRENERGDALGADAAVMRVPDCISHFLDELLAAIAGDVRPSSPHNNSTNPVETAYSLGPLIRFTSSSLSQQSMSRWIARLMRGLLRSVDKAKMRVLKWPQRFKKEQIYGYVWKSRIG